ncbi:MAG: arginine--tRNA ligase [Elusimicrobiota bacterium]
MILESLRKSLVERARAWAKDAGLSLPDNLQFSAPPAHVKADASLAWPMAAAKTSRRNPLETAQSLSAALSGVLEIESVEAVPPGFINIRLRLSALGANLKGVVLSPNDYGRDSDIIQRKILFEFVSANPTGPLHLASGRGATLGDSLVRILRRIGHDVSSEYYVNDAGGRVELLGLSVKARYDEIRGREAHVPDGGYQGEYLKDLAAGLGPEAENWSAREFGRHAMETLLASHKRDMEAFDSHFDRWFKESELHASGAVKETLDFLKNRGMVYEKEGALWLGTASDEKAGDDKDRVLVRSDGRPTYFLPDIAYHKNKYDRGFLELVDIFGADHHGYVPRLKAAISALGHDPGTCHAVVHQLIHLYRGQEAVKMSKRAGTFVSLREVLDEVGKDACRFFFAMRTPDSHLNFDLDLAKKQSSENPVYYCQYVHARICSIFREAVKQGIIPSSRSHSAASPDLLIADEERALLVKMAWFPSVLRTCEKDISPHPLANYMLELAGLFHPFYEKCRVIDSANPGLSQARLLLCGGARDVMAQGLELLGVSAPEQM